MALIKPEQLQSGSYNITGSFSGSFYGDGSNLNNLPVPSIDTGSLVTTSSFNSFTSSYYTDSGSFSTRVTNLENFSSSLDATFATEAELNAATSSLSASISNLSSSFEIFSGSYNTGSFSGSFIGDLTGTASYADSASYALTASYVENAQTSSYVETAQTASYISASNIDGTVLSASYALTASYVENAQTASYVLQAVSASFSSTSSYVNTLNQNVLITGSLTVLQGATIYGSSSFTYITASQLAVSASFISVNVFEPVQRFGGLIVYDSGSSLATASIAWDSLHNHWVYQNTSGSTYTGGMFLSGPRNTGSLGDEPTLTQWFIPRSDGTDHLENSQIYSSGSIHIVTGSLTVTQGVTASLQGTASWASNTLTSSYSNLTVNSTPIGGVVNNGEILYRNGGVLSTSTNLAFNATLGRLSVGQGLSPEARLDIRAQGSSSSDSVLRVRNNGNTFDILTLTGNNILSLSGSSNITGSLNVNNLLYTSGSNIGIGNVSANSAYNTYFSGSTNVSNSIDVGPFGSGGHNLSVRGYTSVGSISTGGYGAIGSNYYLDNTGVLRNRYNDRVSALEFSSGGFLFRTGIASPPNTSVALTSLMYLDRLGTLGLGPNPQTLTSALLHISGANSSSLLKIDSPSNPNILFVTGSGRVGIGTSTPRTIFHVVGNYGGGVDDLIPQMLFQNSNTSPSTNKIAIIRTTVGTGFLDGGYPEIWLEAQQNEGNFGFTKIRTVSNHPMLFLTNDIERARINETGDVGINTQSPAGKLHVKTTTNQNIIFTNGTTGAQIRSLVDGNVAYSGLEFDTLSFNFKTNGSDRIFINSTGDIGIGKTTPNSRLDISGSVIITGSLTSQPITLTVTSGTASINCTQGNFFNLTLSSSSTIHLSSSNIQPGQTINLRITQPATSGSLTYGSQFKFAGGIPYSASATGSVVDIVSFISFDSTTLYGSAIKNLS